MRIISGKYRGTVLKGFDLDGTRPTMDRVKESMFGMIQREIKGATCLDLFAGSGSLGYEALSGGASLSYFVDISKEAILTLEENKKKLNCQAIILKKQYQEALAYFQKEQILFDCIFLDPPYQLNYIGPALRLIEKYGLLKEGGILVCEYETEDFSSSYPCIKERSYGKKQVRIYRRNEE